MGFLTGSPGKFKQISRLDEFQMPLKDQLINAGMDQGAGGAFGDAADYYRDLLSNDSKTFQQLQAPELRRFNEEIVPGLSEQFAGMGAGALSSSGFRNAAVNAGADLSERLGAIRAQLRQQGAAGLAGIGQQGLQQFNENIYQPQTGGLLQSLAPALGTAVGSFLGPLGSAAGGALGKMASNWISGKGKSSPYGDYGYSQPLSSSYDTMFRQQGV